MSITKLTSTLRASLNSRAFSTNATGSAGLLKPITLRTCVGIYDQLRQTWPHFYKNAPQSGIDITVEYADTANDPNAPKEFDQVVVALHGNYGTYQHYDKLLSHYRGTRTRLIVPNFPDFSHTRQTGVYWHSTVERAAFIRDFLKQLGINKIDCFVSHSMAFQFAAAIWGDPTSGLDIKSVACFTPQSFWGEYTPAFDKMKHVFWLRNEAWYRFLELIRIHRFNRWPMKYYNINDFLLNCTVRTDEQSPKDLHHRLEHFLHNSNSPMSLMFGVRDKLIYPASINGIYHKLGINLRDVIAIDPKKEKPEEAIQVNGRRFNSYLVAGGGHLTHVHFSQFANRMVDTLLQQVK